MTTQEVRQRVKTLKEQFQAQMDQLYADVLNSRIYQDGDVLERTRHNPDGSLYDRIQAIVVTADVTLFTDDATDYAFPNVHYWVWVLTEGYQSHQSYIRHRQDVIPYNLAEDFWQGDVRWKLIAEPIKTELYV